MVLNCFLYITPATAAQLNPMVIHKHLNRLLDLTETLRLFTSK